MQTKRHSNPVTHDIQLQIHLVIRSKIHSIKVQIQQLIEIQLQHILLQIPNHLLN